MISYCIYHIYTICSNHLNLIKKEIKEREFKVNCVRIASAMMNKSPFIWDVELEKDKKTTDKILNRNMVKEKRIIGLGIIVILQKNAKNINS